MIGWPLSEASARRGRGTNSTRLPIHLLMARGRPRLERATAVDDLAATAAELEDPS